MRIISGKFRGKKLNSPKDDKVRPTTDMVKENIFNIIQNAVPNSRFLDLFAGSGGIGIEAISRGASSVTFCDNDRDSMNLLNTNLSDIDYSPRLINADYNEALRRLKGEKFDIIYLDPPYNKINLSQVMALIQEYDLLDRRGIVVCEGNLDTPPTIVSKYFSKLSKRKYGSVVVDVFGRNYRGLVMGSFDPITLGHVNIIERALEIVDEVVICVMVNPDKQVMYDLNTRIEMIRKTTQNMGNVTIDYYTGMCYEYCKANAIDIIVRGYRNKQDYEYENEMAEFNLSYGGMKTILLQADEQLSNLSSSAVRQKLEEGKSTSGMVPELIKDELMKLER